MECEDLIREQAYLVARGVRTLALINSCEGDEVTMLRTATKLEGLSVPGAIAFVIDRGDGRADYGFSAMRWAIDLLRWTNSDAVPLVQRHRVLGLLLGYSADAIREFEEQASGRVFSFGSPG